MKKQTRPFLGIKGTLLILALALAAQKAGAIGFTVSPAELRAVTAAAATATDVITVANTSSRAVRFKAYLNDWTVTRSGADSICDPGTLSNSCAPWTAVNPAEFEVPAGGTEKLRVTFSPTSNSNGGYWSMLYVESAPIPSSWSSNVQVNARVGVRLYADIAGTEVRDCEVVDLHVNTDKDLEVIGKVLNTGNVPVRLKGKMEIRDKDGKAVWAKECNQLALPGLEARLSVTPDVTLSKGEYLAVLTLDYGSKELLVGERAVTIAGPKTAGR